ncbi:hypothetical protein GCM10009639_05330 [Kitasatospora putterlickiae]|uniref:DUF3040 domain-containing protein n=1 Tax=Kitasatospora putterlickiae TaxID=221725 RepID=A0ABN1XKL8_9ACTN
MDGPGLSSRERRILAEIEGDLRADRRLDQRLRTMRFVLPGAPGRALDAAARVPGSVLALLTALSVGLLLVGATVHTAVALTLFSVVWLPTVVLLSARGLRTRSHRGCPGRGG